MDLHHYSVKFTYPSAIVTLNKVAIDQYCVEKY
jgi:hypothetical protein